MNDDRVCCRCHQPKRRINCEFPDGPICTVCFLRLLRRVDTCEQCGHIGPTPGRTGTIRLCSICAGLGRFACSTCDADDQPMAGRTCCNHCRSRERVVAALDLDDDRFLAINGAIEVLARRSPTTIGSWLDRNTDVLSMIRTVHTDRREFRHDDFDTIDRPGVARNLRRKFIAAKLLEDRHHGLDLFDTWTRSFLDDIDDRTHRKTLHAFIRWSQRRRLEAAIDVGTIKAGSFRVARRYIRAADRFLRSMHAAGADLSSCDQHLVDRWFADGNSVLSFLIWAKQQRLIDPRIMLPVPQAGTAAGMTTNERIEVIRHLFSTDELSPGDRFAGLLVAVYAQPVTKISRMRRSEIILDRTPVTARLGQRAIELDDHVAAVCAEHLASSDASEGWLFPGKTAGQPVSSHGLGERLRRHGVTRAARVSALHDLTRQVPSTILADLIGYNRFVIANRADVLAEPWQLYAALAAGDMAGAHDVKPKAAAGA
jgi:hypothetical protein